MDIKGLTRLSTELTNCGLLLKALSGGCEALDKTKGPGKDHEGPILPREAVLVSMGREKPPLIKLIPFPLSTTARHTSGGIGIHTPVGFYPIR